MNLQPMIISNKVYQHHTGYYVYVNTIVDAGDEPRVIYTELESGNQLSLIADEFIARVGDTFNFVPVNTVNTALSVSTTKELIEELEKRPDNPYEVMRSLEEDKDVYAVDFLLGKIVRTCDCVTMEDVETFMLLTPNVFNSYEEAKRHAERFYPHKAWKIVRRVTRAVSE